MADRKTAADLVLTPLPSGWTWAKLDDLRASEPNSMTDGPFGSKLKSNDYTSSGVRVIRLGNIGLGRLKLKNESYVSFEKFESLSKHELFAGDIVIAALAEPVGRCAVVPATLGKALVKADCIRLKVGCVVERDYLAYALNSPAGLARAAELSHGLGRLRINMGNMKELPAPVPPLNEQRRIVAKLDACMTHTKKAKEALDAIPPLLEKFRQSVLAAAFRGDLTKDWREENPDVEPASELLKRIRVERRQKWEEDYLGRQRAKGKEPKNDKWKAKYKPPRIVGSDWLPALPNTWSWSSADTVCSRVVDCHNKTAPYVPDGIPLLRTSNIRGGRLRFSDLKFITRETYEFWSRRCPPQEHDVLFTREAPMGEAAMVPADLTVCMGQRMMLLRASPGFLNPAYLHGAVQAPTIAEYAKRFGVGTGVKHLRVRDVEALPIPVAPEAEQQALVTRLRAALAGVDHLERLLTRAIIVDEQLNASLLAKAFRGELVPQDPNDEPASVLLERIRAERAAAAAAKPKKKRKTKKAKA